MKLVYHLLILLLLKYSSGCFSGVNKETNVVTLPSNGTITYNFYCLKDNNDGCDIMKYNIKGALNMLLAYFGKYASPCTFDFIVDDFSNIKTDIDMPVVPLNTDFEPLIPDIKKVFDLYPNHRTLEKKIYKKNNDKVDFILVANKLKNEKDHYEDMLITHYSVILEALFYGMIENTTVRNKVLSYITYNRDIYSPPGWTNDPQTNTLLDKGDGPLSTEKKNIKRIVSIGDIHGDYDKLVQILTHARLIDKKKNWIGTDVILVQNGDLHEKGDYSKEILDLLIKLRKQAKSKGGEVQLILGNHDLYTISGYFDCAYLTDIFKSGSTEKRKKTYSLETKYGKLLRQEMDIVKIVDDMIFVHGGLTSEFAAMGVDEINKKAHEIFTKAKYDDYLLDTDPILSDDGPLLTRFFSQNDDTEAVCKELDKVLAMTNTTRMIVGHTPQENGKINTLCDNKLIMIDIGLTGFYGNRFGYLEIKRDSNEFWAIYN